ncbi:unnamed protein product, partial [Polarella glacialis]
MWTESGQLTLKSFFEVRIFVAVNGALPADVFPAAVSGQVSTLWEQQSQAPGRILSIIGLNLGTELEKSFDEHQAQQYQGQLKRQLMLFRSDLICLQGLNPLTGCVGEVIAAALKDEGFDYAWAASGVQENAGLRSAYAAKTTQKWHVTLREPVAAGPTVVDSPYQGPSFLSFQMCTSLDDACGKCRLILRNGLQDPAGELAPLAFNDFYLPFPEERKRDEKLYKAVAELAPGVSLPITLARFTQDMLPAVVRLHQAQLPMSYSDEFFQVALQSAQWARVALWDDVVVGAIICKEMEGFAHVQSLVAAVPRRKIGSRLLGAVLKEAEGRGVTKSRLHVHVRNESAVALYTSLGFRTDLRKVGYYQRSAEKLEDPPDAFLMIRHSSPAALFAALSVPASLVSCARRLKSDTLAALLVRHFEHDGAVAVDLQAHLCEESPGIIRVVNIKAKVPTSDDNGLEHLFDRQDGQPLIVCADCSNLGGAEAFSVMEEFQRLRSLAFEVFGKEMQVPLGSFERTGASNVNKLVSPDCLLF